MRLQSNERTFLRTRDGCSFPESNFDPMYNPHADLMFGNKSMKAQLSKYQSDCICLLHEIPTLKNIELCLEWLDNQPCKGVNYPRLRVEAERMHKEFWEKKPVKEEITDDHGRKQDAGVAGVCG